MAEYNGWPNKVTWGVHLAMTNSEAAEQTYRRVVQSELALIHAGDHLQEAFTQHVEMLWAEIQREVPYFPPAAQELRDAIYYATKDLIDTALSHVDWCAVAAALRGDD